MLGTLVRFLLRIIYRVELRGREHYDEAGARTLILCNQGSIIDPLLLSAMLPDIIAILADKALEHKWWMRPVCALTDTLFLDFSSPTATVSLVHALMKNGRCMVFHSGSISNDPHYVKILEAAGVIAERARAALLPVRIDGAQSTIFSYLRHKRRHRWFPRVSIRIMEPQTCRCHGTMKSRERRRLLGERLYDIMTSLEYRASMEDCNLLRAVMDAASVSGRKFPIAEDQDRNVLTYGDLLLKLSVLGRAFRRVFYGEKRVGFLLPTSLPGLVAFLGLHAAQMVPAMLNFTSGVSAVLSCCRTVQISYVLTSRRFIALADLSALESALKEEGLNIVYLEDVAKHLKIGEKIFGFLAARLHRAPATPADDAAAVMFTSGTEGVPKAVFLSHANIIANRHQALSVLTVGAGDKLFNCLPMFHA
ncbi:MAG: AMP-binding protein, partial [Mailhella sp.]